MCSSLIHFSPHPQNSVTAIKSQSISAKSSKLIISQMASMAQLPVLLPAKSIKQSTPSFSSSNVRTTFLGSTISSRRTVQETGERKPLTVVAAAGDVSSDGTIYLIAGAAAVALVGTAFPILFSRKDTCPECDGAGFVRKAGATLRVNAARKDEVQIVCATCNGLGKLNQIDKK